MFRSDPQRENGDTMNIGRIVLIVCVASIVAGCMGTHHVPLNSGAALEKATGVTTRAGVEIQFGTTGATITNDTLHAVGIHGQVSLPADSIERISIEKFDPRRTGALVIGVAFVAFVTLLFISLNSLGSIGCLRRKSRFASECLAVMPRRRQRQMRRARLAIIVVLSACASRRTTATRALASCQKVTSRSTESRFRSSAALAGTFRLVLVRTSEPVDHSDNVFRASTHVLTLADSAQRAASRVRGLGHAPRADLRLLGEWRNSPSERATEAEIDGSLLYLGCRDCMDASPTVLRIIEVDERGFFGTWRNYQTGIGRLLDKSTGDPLPDPAGYFCAWRR
jgi:hypothetical protein